MHKIQKYYQYIAEDIVNDVVFTQYDEWGKRYKTKGYFDGNFIGLYIQLPFNTLGGEMEMLKIGRNIDIPYELKYPTYDFEVYVIEKYGAREEDTDIIFTLFHTRLLGILGMSVD